MFMSRCVNKATLIGYLGADPVIRTIPGGARVAHLSLATTRRWSDGEGPPQKKTEWHRVSVWDSLPGAFAFVEKYLRKGDRVYVEGEINYRSYDDNGTTRWSTVIKAAEVMAAGEPSGAGENAGSGTRRRARGRFRVESAGVQLSVL
jgi:single-strand DNA-binding protein